MSYINTISDNCKADWYQSYITHLDLDHPHSIFWPVVHKRRITDPLSWQWIAPTSDQTLHHFTKTCNICIKQMMQMNSKDFKHHMRTCIWDILSFIRLPFSNTTSTWRNSNATERPPVLRDHLQLAYQYYVIVIQPEVGLGDSCNIQCLFYVVTILI